MSTDPTVSILMTSYNREAFIGAAIESVLASSFGDFELIIVDDASTDATVATAQNYAAQDKRIKLHKNDKNLGDYPNRNRAASFATGTYVKYVDSDDMLYPWGVAAMVSCIRRHPDAGIGLSTIDLPERPHPVRLDPRQAYLTHYFERDLFGRAPASAIIRREAFERCGGFTGRRQVGDHELWMLLSRRYAVVTMPRDLIWDRVHGAQEQFADSSAEKDALHVEVDIENLLHSDCPLNQTERHDALGRLCATKRRLLANALVRRRSLREFRSYQRQLRSLGAAMAQVS